MGLPYSGERFMPGYDGPGIHLEHLHRYSLAAALVEGAVLDLGCGIGYGSRLLARSARRVVGVDLSAEAIDFARKAFAGPQVRYAAADARQLPFGPASFDWVVCFELIEHLLECEEVVAEIARVLSPQGKLILSTPNRPLYSEAAGYSNPFHRRELDSRELSALLSGPFDDVSLFGQRLVAGSIVWDVGTEAAAERLQSFPADPALAPGLEITEGPRYLIALCGRRRAGRPAGMPASVLTGRLEAFLEEQAGRQKLAESGIHSEYQAVIDRLVAQLGEFDARIRQLGGEVDFHHASKVEEVATLAGQLAEERSRALSLENERENLEARIRDLQSQVAANSARTVALKRQRREALAALGSDLALERSRRQALEAEVRRSSEEINNLQRQFDELSATALKVERDREINGLRLTIERVQADLDWSYRHWQEREAELKAIRRSKMWQAWMAYHALRRAVRAPFSKSQQLLAAAARAVGTRLRAAARVPFRALGWLYLVSWTAWTHLIAALRRHRPAPDEPGQAASVSPPAAVGRRPRILVLCPYSLYPADHGGGVRISNLVRRLARHFAVHLLIFTQKDDDAEQRQVLEAWVEKVYFHRWQPRLKPDFWGLKPPAAQLFEAPEVRALVNEILSREGIDILQLEYTELGQYGLPPFARVKVVLTEIDIAFRSSARRRRTGMHRRYTVGRLFGHSHADWMRQLRYELQVARRADQVHVMSRADGACLARFLPDGWAKLRVVPNAVDVEDYQPPSALRRTKELLFVGNFEHLPNLDALDYLIEEVWPHVRSRVPDAELTVVGARGGEAVLRHEGQNGISVAGTVARTKPFYQRCRALVAPIRAGSGTRLKILEALACGAPVLTTTIGAEGIEGAHERDFLIADTSASLIEGACRLLEDDELCARLGSSGRRLVERLYSWERSVEAARAGYADLLSAESPPDVPAGKPASPAEVDVSVVIPTLNGGDLLERCLASVRQQQTERSVEIVCVDSGSTAADLAMMERHAARVIGIEREQFNHGLTRDLGAAESRGRILVFLNQDAVPAGSDWLDELIAPLAGGNGCAAAVQGAILEVPSRGERFFWDSCGDRFYFTRESKRWIERYFGIGFSTVNAAMRRDVWQRHPFGDVSMMEDKKWQREAVAAGHAIATAPAAAVHHTHNYGLKALVRRCENEGFGWRGVGEKYTFRDMAADMLRPKMYAELARGLAKGEIRTWAELLFPLLRPVLLFRGNRWGRRLKT